MILLHRFLSLLLNIIRTHHQRDNRDCMGGLNDAPRSLGSREKDEPDE